MATREDAAPIERRPDEVVAAVQAELVAALKRADALRAEAEQARAALERSHRQKDEFLAMLAHELRNPLGPILNAAELLETMAGKDATVERASQILVRQAGLLTRLVDDLVDAARISGGKLEVRLEPVDLVALVATLADDMDASFRARGITFSAQLPATPMWVDADPQRLAQAVGNLLANAAKFTDSGGTVTVQLTGEDGSSARLSVTDNGAGMTAELLDRVFDPFSQAHGSDPRNPSGLGLGTAIARGVVELHGGTIEAHSLGEGTGSTFTIRLPVRQSSPAAAADEHPTPSSGQRRVVVIDDNVDAAEVIQIILESLGHVVAVAHDGATGARLARRLAADIVLCDLGLPGEMDGIAVARTLSTATHKPYLVALTGYGREEDRRRALEAGFDLHLTKPVDIVTLEQALERPTASDIT